MESIVFILVIDLTNILQFLTLIIEVDFQSIIDYIIHNQN